MSLITVENLTVSFGGCVVVDRVGFTLDRGETLALVGESGSGKSLTALSLLQLLPPGAACRGHVVVDGQSVIGAGDRLLRRLRGGVAGMVFQEPMTSLNPLDPDRRADRRGGAAAPAGDPGGGAGAGYRTARTRSAFPTRRTGSTRSRISCPAASGSG